jgi:hypothetical protein
MFFFTVRIVIVAVIINLLVNGALEFLVLGHFSVRNGKTRGAVPFRLSSIFFGKYFTSH